MADIELVIKIPEEEYRWIMKSDKTVFADVASKECMLYVIKEGIPLPKGHGRLIDADAITKDLNTFQDAFVIHTDGTYRMAISCKAPTIIEAYKAESEG